MDSGWSEPKLIDWEYKGESDDDSGLGNIFIV